MFGMQIGQMGQVGGFSLTRLIASMYQNGEQGAWYDPSDMSTLFQDSAGTTPVTAVEQPVGLMLDKSGWGNHASMATTTKRPTYSRRVNLLTKTEQFDDPGWVKTRVSVAVEGSGGAGFLIIPSTELGSHIMQETVGVTSGAVHTLSIKAKKAGYRYFYFAQLNGPTTGSVFDFDTGTYGVSAGTGATYSAELLPDGFWLLSMTFTTGAGVTSVITEACSMPLSYFSTFTGDGVSGALIKEASLTLATDAHLPYQWVNTATDYDTAGFPHYLKFNGTNTTYATPSIDFTGTDKMTVWAGAWAPPDDGRNSAIVCIPDTGLSRYWLGHPFSGFTYSAAAGATTERSISAPFVAGNAIITASLDLSGVQKVAINGGTPLVNAAGTGGGNFRNAPICIGADISSNRFYFNGRIYSLIVRGAQSSLSQIEAVENLIRQKMRLP